MTDGRGCVFVIGMHRSGTSAVAGVLTGLGVSGPRHDDLVPATATNERGHFESKSLTQIDNQLLHILGGTWSAPPALAPGWHDTRAIAAVGRRATATFDAAFPTRPMAWKDPRNCIVLPFWRALLPPMAAVLVYRDGLEVALSLRSRNQINLTHGLALWERYLRSASAALAGVPTYCTDYGRLLDDPAATCAELVAFLGTVGIAVNEALVPAAVASLDAGLRHEQPATIRPEGTVASADAVMDAIRGLDGPHHRWPAPDLGPEPEWVEDVLALRREYEVLDRQLRSSRAMRLVEHWWSLHGARRPPPSPGGDDT